VQSVANYNNNTPAATTPIKAAPTPLILAAPLGFAGVIDVTGCEPPFPELLAVELGLESEVIVTEPLLTIGGITGGGTRVVCGIVEPGTPTLGVEVQVMVSQDTVPAPWVMLRHMDDV
jgi:hypothetical protein